MRIGVLALEHPPASGGMERLAYMHIGWLARAHEIVAYVRTHPGSAGHAGVRYVDGLSGDARRDLPRLKAETVDVWLIFNSGLACYIDSLAAPAVVMAHGNDFLKPWLPVLGGWPQQRVALVKAALGYRVSVVAEAAERRRLVRNNLSKARRIIAVSRFSREALSHLLGAGTPPIDVVNPCLADQWLAEATPRSGKRRDGPLRLLTVCRLDARNRRKNVEGVLQALAMFRPGEFAYTVVGEGDDRARLETVATTLGLSDVRFAGRVNDAELRTAYAEADLFVMPVRPVADDVEGFGMVFSEAAAYGAPSLATRTGGIPDAIAEGVSGMLLDTPEPPAIAEALRNFAEGRDAFDARAIRAFAETFAIETLGPKIEAVLVDAAKPI